MQYPCIKRIAHEGYSYRGFYRSWVLYYDFKNKEYFYTYQAARYKLKHLLKILNEI